jgi:hypothetical protein
MAINSKEYTVTNTKSFNRRRPNHRRSFEDEDIQHEDTAMEFSDLYLMAQEYYSSLDYPHQLNLMDMFMRSSCFIRF